jgi:hypothetical protein
MKDVPILGDQAPQGGGGPFPVDAGERIRGPSLPRLGIGTLRAVTVVMDVARGVAMRLPGELAQLPPLSLARPVFREGRTGPLWCGEGGGYVPGDEDGSVGAGPLGPATAFTSPIPESALPAEMVVFPPTLTPAIMAALMPVDVTPDTGSSVGK